MEQSIIEKRQLIQNAEKVRNELGAEITAEIDKICKKYGVSFEVKITEIDAKNILSELRNRVIQNQNIGNNSPPPMFVVKPSIYFIEDKEEVEKDVVVKSGG